MSICGFLIFAGLVESNFVSLVSTVACAQAIDAEATIASASSVSLFIGK
jgi:hypothetical protein